MNGKIINNAMGTQKKRNKLTEHKNLYLEFGFHTVADFLDERFTVLEPVPPDILKELMTSRESCQS